MTGYRRVRTWYGWRTEPVQTTQPAESVQAAPEPLPAPKKKQPPVHGTRRRYAKGCRCSACRRRESEYRAGWRLRTGQTKTSRVLGER